MHDPVGSGRLSDDVSLRVNVAVGVCPARKIDGSPALGACKRLSPNDQKPRACAPLGGRVLPAPHIAQAIFSTTLP